jgi:hypothetical protein
VIQSDQNLLSLFERLSAYGRAMIALSASSQAFDRKRAATRFNRGNDRGGFLVDIHFHDRGIKYYAAICWSATDSLPSGVYGDLRRFPFDPLGCRL